MQPAEFDPMGFAPNEDARPLLERARQIAHEGKRVPPGFEGRLLATIAAAWELHLPWRISPDLKAQWDEVMLAWSAKGGDVDWWAQSEGRIDTPVAIVPEPWAKAWREAEIESETAPGYKASPGMSRTYGRILSRREAELRDRFPGQDDASYHMAALNDLCRDVSDLGVHARRVRAMWLKDEERRGRRP